MDPKTIEFATAHAILASLTGSKELVLYDDPLNEILQLCGKTKGVIHGYGTGIPEDLPIKISTDVAQEIFLRCAKNDWDKKESKLSDKERHNLIKSILAKVDKKMRSHVAEELKDIDMAPNEFLLKLDSLNKTDLGEKLNEWSSYGGELDIVFDTVSQPPKKRKKSDLARAITNLSKFTDKWKDQEIGDHKLEDLRDIWAFQIEKLFTTSRRVPKGYPGKKLPRYQYIRKKFLPYLIFTSSPMKHLKSITDEKNIYEAYKNMFETKKSASKRIHV